MRSTAPTPRPRPALAALVLAVLVAGCSSRAQPTQLWGVRLGLSPMMVRARFEAPGPGVFRTLPAAELTVEWAGSAVSSSPSRVQFEFHDGMLVALRARVASHDPAAQGPTLVVSNAAVLARHGAGTSQTEVALLARDCPSHADEVRRLLVAR